MEKKYDDEPYTLHGYEQISDGHAGSQQSWIYKARKNGEEYGIKFHRHITRPPDPVKDEENDPEGVKYEKAKKRVKGTQAKFAAYCDYKTRLYTAVREAGLNGPADFWIGEGLLACDNKQTFMEADRWLSKKASCLRGEADICTMDLDDAAKLSLLTSFAQDLYKLHAAGIVHSDIKPDNIIIGEDGGALRARAIDFDMSFFAADPPDIDSALAIRPFIMGGTDDYKSPEMCCFDASLTSEEYDISQMSYNVDIFATGVTFYEFLMGKNVVIPLEGGKEEEYLRGIGKALIDGQKINLEPLYTSFANEKYGRFWFALLGWMLDKDASARPTAEQLLEVLEGFNERPIPARYKKTDPFAPWEEDGIRFNEERIAAEKVEISRGKKPGIYRFTNTVNRMSYGKSVRQLVDAGYAVFTNSATPWQEDNITYIPRDGYSVRLGASSGEYTVTMPTGEELTFDKARLLSEGLAHEDTSAAQPWADDNIVLIPKDGVSISRSKVEGTYRLQRGGITKVCNKTTLLSEGLARVADANYNRPWDGDGLTFKGRYGVSISRAEGGMYKVKTAYSARVVTKEQLVAEGLASMVYAGNPQPWSGDLIELKPTAGYTVTRADTLGMYKVRDVANAVTVCNAAKLIERGLAVENKKSLPWESDGIRFVAKDGVVITRGAIEGRYNITSRGFTRGGTAEALKSLGYAAPLASAAVTSTSFEFWPCDSELELCAPANCTIERAKREPMYVVKKSGLSLILGKAQLIAQHIAKVK